MNSAKLFIIDYTLHGEPKSFIIRHAALDNVTAWYWAGCDAGVERIARNEREAAKKLDRAQMERKGIANVKWRLAST